MSLRKRKRQARNLLSEVLTVEEIVALEELSKHHCYALYGFSAASLFEASRTEFWAKGGFERSLVGILGEHKGGAPARLTPKMLEVAAGIDRQEPLTLAKLPTQLHEQFPDSRPIAQNSISLNTIDKFSSLGLAMPYSVKLKPC